MKPLRIDSLKYMLSHHSSRVNCLEWPYANIAGYGAVWLQGKRGVVPRVSWELTFGPIPPGMFVLHRCDNPKCFNPAHLFLGTKQDNTTDMRAKGRARGASHKGSANGLSKLLEDDVPRIRYLISLGMPYRIIAKQYGVSKGLISHIANGRSWRHV